MLLNDIINLTIKEKKINEIKTFISDGEKLFDNVKTSLEKNWKDFIPETEHVLSPSSGGGYFFARYIVDVITQVVQYNAKGDNMGTIELPGIGTARGWNGTKEEETLYYSFTN